MASSGPRNKRKSSSPSPSLDLTVLGMCAGTSLSGVGCTLVRYHQENPAELLHMEVIVYEEVAVSLHIRTLILTLLRDQRKNPHAMLKVHFVLGRMLSSTIQHFCNAHDISHESIDLVAAQADSIPASVLPSSYWTAEDKPEFKSWTAVVAAETQLTTATNLPLTRRPRNASEPSTEASIDSLFLQHPTKFRVCLTINDLINISLIPPSESSIPPTNPPNPPGTDCGPGTMFIDYAMRYATSNQKHHDYDGRYSARGSINQSIVDRFLATHDYSRHAPSSSIAVEMFGQHEAQGLIDDCLFLGMSDYDTVATVTRITAHNIVIQHKRLMDTFFPGHKIDEMFICGPGANYIAIVDHLEDTCPGILTKPLDDIGIPGDAKDSVRSAQLGLETVLRHAQLGGKSAEAQEQSNLLGNMVPGKKWEKIRDHIARFSGGKELPAAQRVVVVRKET